MTDAARRSPLRAAVNIEPCEYRRSAPKSTLCLGNTSDNKAKKMHRIDGPGATIDNLFTEGDPTQGMPATTVTGAWLNAVQEEIANVVDGAGIDLNKLDNTQLLAAIRRLINEGQNLTTGDIKFTIKTVADAGWVMCNDGTIGKTGSGAPRAPTTTASRCSRCCGTTSATASRRSAVAEASRRRPTGRPARRSSSPA